MTQIYEPIEITSKLLGEQKIDKTKKYRPLTYTLKYDVDRGLLIYNVLTRELVLLSSDERQYFENNIDTNNDIVNELIKKYFLVPTDNNDVKLNKQATDFLYNLHASLDVPITTYTMFPTTKCNARCFYCFERNREYKDMTPETANDVADFIIKKSCGQKVKFRWFGGEPLYNKQAIEIICKKLKEANIDFFSTFVSNGFLFDEATVKQAVTEWNMTEVQITLDGTEEIYNRCKNFIYEGVSAYKVVYENIGHLLKANVITSIRLNVDSHNLKDLYKLTELLFESYGNYKNFVIYGHLLFEDSGKLQKERTDEQRHELMREFDAFEDYLFKKLKRKPKTVKSLLRYNQCMADDPKATTILPDGNLGKCEHYSDTDFWGNIYSNRVDKNVIADFRRYKYLGEMCDKCAYAPACRQIIRCPQTIMRCDEADMHVRTKFVRNAIMRTYKDYCEENPII